MDSKQTLNEPDGLTIRLRFARREPAIWLAHLDLMRTFERSIRRAGLPVAIPRASTRARSLPSPCRSARGWPPGMIMSISA